MSSTFDGYFVHFTIHHSDGNMGESDASHSCIGGSSKVSNQSFVSDCSRKDYKHLAFPCFFFMLLPLFFFSYSCSLVHKYLDSDRVFVILSLHTPVDLKRTNQDMIEVLTFSLKLRCLTKIPHQPFRNYSHFLHRPM